MDVNRTWGVEIELYCSVSRASVAEMLTEALSPIGHRAVIQGYSHQNNPDNTSVWYVETDGSLADANHTHPHAMEVKTPVLKGVLGLKALKIVCSVLGTVGRVTKKCGLHVHHYVNPNERHAHMKNLCNGWIDNEKYFMMCLPESRQRNNYCKTWASANPSRVTTRSAMSWYENTMGGMDGRRKRTLNLMSLSMRSTLEFRCHSGTYEFEKICNWLISTQRFVIKAMRGDFIFQKANTFDEFITFMQTDFTPEAIDTMQQSATAAGEDNAMGVVTDLTVALMHPDAKKKRLPRPGTKAYTIATLLIHGATKDQIIDALDERHGHIGHAKQSKFVAGQLTNMKNPKYSWGFRIQKNRRTGEFRIVPHDGGTMPTAQVPASVEVPETSSLPMASKLDLRSMNWLKSRKEYFSAQRATHRLRSSRPLHEDDEAVDMFDD